MMMNFNRVILLAGSVVACMSVSLFSQQEARPARKPTSSNMTGRVFGITKGGDLKPARLADVFFFYTNAVRDGKGIDSGDTAGIEYMKASVKASESYREDMKSGRLGSYSENIYCLADLKYKVQAVDDTLAWAQDNKKAIQVKTVQTDEEGYFKISLPAGNYEVIAHGQAGLGNAFWHTTWVAPRDGELKLSSPEIACSTTE